MHQQRNRFAKPAIAATVYIHSTLYTEPMPHHTDARNKGTNTSGIEFLSPAIEDTQRALLH